MNKIPKTTRLESATSQRGFANNLSYCRNPTKSHCGNIRLLVKESAPVHKIKPYIHTTIATVVGAKIIFGNHISNRSMMDRLFRS